ncbi:Uncharacterized protein SCG7109_AA_00420 [Chlamydiales bacterium SCGC AG-110-M15]|nr:Uncharacterized protein SCG7109_AA_00420 [Chlamydiales bacterium SCGC AG-110-M15]
MEKPTNGSLCWFDMPVRNFEETQAFYKELLGWSFQKFGSEGADREYWMMLCGEQQIGGMYQIPDFEPANALVPVMYFVVETLDQSLEKAKSLGAKVTQEKTIIPEEGGVYAHIKDINGNTVGLWAKQ